MVQGRVLERIVQDVRDNTPKEPTERVEAWAARTWAIALERYSQERPELERVVEARERSDRLKQQMGEPLTVKEED